MGRSGYMGYRDLKVYQLAYKLALEIHEISKSLWYGREGGQILEVDPPPAPL